MGVGNRIEALCADKGLSIRKLALTADVPYSTLYSAIKRNSNGIDLDTLKKIANALGVHYSILLTDNPEEQAIFTSDSDTTRVHMLRGNIVARELYSDGEISPTPKEIETYQREIALFEGLIEDYKALSIEGQQVAAERVHELTEIPRYQRKDTSEE